MTDTTVEMTTTLINVCCVSATCCGQAKQLSRWYGYMKRCGLCDARRPFRQMLKCFDCKTVYHRPCVMKTLERREPAEGSQASAGDRGDGICEIPRANPETTTETTFTETCYRQIMEDAPTEVCGASVRENIPANPDTTTMAAAAAIVATTTNDCLPPTRRTEITSMEYFRHVFEEVLSEERVMHLKAAIARAPRPSPARSSLTWTDYQEMSAAWDDLTIHKSNRNRPREMHRTVYSMTVRNTSYHKLKRVRFGCDPSLKSDR